MKKSVNYFDWFMISNTKFLVFDINNAVTLLNCSWIGGVYQM